MFKKGDKVRRISSDWGNVVKGNIYTVQQHTPSDAVFLEEDRIGLAYAGKGFELANANGFPELKSGMRVRIRGNGGDTRTGSFYVVVKDANILVSNTGFNWLDRNDSSSGKWIDEEGVASKPYWDIVEVYEGLINQYFANPDKRGALIWQEVDPEKEARAKRRKEILEKITGLNEKIGVLETELDSIPED